MQMYPQSVSAGTRVEIVYHPVTRHIGEVNYTGRLYIQLPGEDVKPVGRQYPPPGSAPLIPQEDITILIAVHVVNADTGAETGKDYETAADQKPDTPELVTWNFTDTGQLRWRHSGVQVPIRPPSTRSSIKLQLSD